MNVQVNRDFWALTEKEKQTLRLIVRGHDAKSVARSLDLSVHTINERLRDARRKMAVSSSREAARLLLEAEGDPGGLTPEMLGDTQIGADARVAGADHGAAPIGGAWRRSRRFLIICGALIMTFVLGLLALTAVPLAVTAPAPAQDAAGAAINPEVVDAARHWLELGDQARWADAYQATGASFHQLNTLQTWINASEQVRVPLGKMLSRTVTSEEFLPAPPYGYEVVKFRTSFANKADVVETVTLNHEGGQWRPVGVTIG